MSFDEISDLTAGVFQYLLRSIVLLCTEVLRGIYHTTNYIIDT